MKWGKSSVFQRLGNSRNPWKPLTMKLRIWGSEVRILSGAPFRAKLGTPNTAVFALEAATSVRSSTQGGKHRVDLSRAPIDARLIQTGIVLLNEGTHVGR